MNKNICVVGAGYWGENHIKTLNRLNALKGIVELDHKVPPYREQLQVRAMLCNYLNQL